MRRRVARVLRWLLFAGGLTFAVLLPVSSFASINLSFFDRFMIQIADLAACMIVLPQTPGLSVQVHDVYVVGSPLWPRKAQLPTYAGGVMTLYSIPLWLLSLICLAWPVTSFILARRKPKRGFPVEVATSSGVGSGPPLPPGEGGGGGREATG